MVGDGSAGKFKMVGGPQSPKKLPPHTVIAGIALNSLDRSIIKSLEGGYLMSIVSK